MGIIVKPKRSVGRKKTTVYLFDSKKIYLCDVSGASKKIEPFFHICQPAKIDQF